MDDADFSQNFWLFGYGSLIWKPPPHFDKRVPGYITGYVRRFWQASEDHRGTPEAPGRVVTLIDHSHWQTLSLQDPHKTTTTTKVWGAAYHIPPQHVPEVREYLDLREINGYSIQYTPFHPASSPISNPAPEPINCLVYIGLPDNPQFVGPQELDGLARWILRSTGPSGDNREYLYQLGRALEELSSESGDEHVRDLVRRCRDLEKRELELGADSRHEEVEGQSDGRGLKKEGSTDEQEEIEK